VQGAVAAGLRIEFQVDRELTGIVIGKKVGRCVVVGWFGSFGSFGWGETDRGQSVGRLVGWLVWLGGEAVREGSRSVGRCVV
jgi:hypothetical protein